MTSHPSHPLDPPLHKAAAATTAKQAAAAAAVGDGGRPDTDTDFIQSACDSSTAGTGYNRGENALNKTRRSAIAPKERAMRRVSVEISPAVAQQCRNYLYDKSRTTRVARWKQTNESGQRTRSCHPVPLCRSFALHRSAPSLSLLAV